MTDNYTPEDSNKFIEILFNSMPFSYIFWKNTNGVYMGASTQQIKMFGKDVKDAKGFIGKTIFEVLEDYDTAQLIDITDREVMKTGIPQTLEESIIMPNGEKKFFLSQKQPIRNTENKIIGLLGFSLDITERKELEDELRKAKELAEISSQAKSKFIQNMSHDIRTPLTGIIGLSNILAQDAFNEANRENAKMLNASGEQLLSLLNSVLDIASSGSVSERLEITSFSIHNLLHNLLELELPALKINNLTLQLKIDEKIPFLIASDKEKMYRILLNLLSNSIKFTEEGFITITAKLIDTNENDLTLQFIITDSGIGIPKTDIKKIFNAFYRVHPSYEGKYKGFGIGLHLVKQYVDILNGTIRVKSIEGKGTTFYFTLHVQKVAHAEEIHSVNLKKNTASFRPHSAPLVAIVSQEKENLLTTKANVLLVEDNPVAMKVATMILSKAGVTTDTAYNSRDAFSLFVKNRYDFVVTDIGLPDFSGFELAKKMQAYEKSNRLGDRTTPIIGLTAHAGQEAFSECDKSAIVKLCEKPLTTKMVDAYIAQYAHFSKEEDKEAASSELISKELPLLDIELGISYLGSLHIFGEMLEILTHQSMKTVITDLSKYYRNNEWQLFKKAAHQFKSSCLYCATTKLLSCTQELELLADTQDSKTIEPVYQKFLKCLAETRSHIKAWLCSNYTLKDQ